jgi:predicted regulator of Ras-like GTPase activity (Roadblock/LC7/MglB family)
MARQFFILSEDAIKTIEKLLAELAEETHANYIQVIDRSGYVVVAHGRPTHVHPEELGAIAAGILSAMQVIVNLAESKESTIKFHSKTMTNFHFIWINPRVFLLVAFDGTANESLVRSKARRTAELIHPHVSQDDTQPADLRSVQFIEDKLSEMFLDS